MSERGREPAGPLAGISVLELGTMYAAPTCGRMLRDFGAGVVKVEDPATGDYARHWTPQKNGLSLGFARLNAGKQSVGIDLRQPDGRDLVRRLAATVDVVVESFRPGRLEEWDLGYEVLAADNPRLILTRVSGFGQTGPSRKLPGFGTVAETASGYAFINGWPDTPPTSPPFGFADSIAGISAAMGTAMALYQRERTGTGDVIDVALYEPLMFMMGDVILKYSTLGEIQQREGNGTGSASPRGIYQAADGGWLSIAASNEAIARRLFRAMGRPELSDDPRFATNPARMANNDAIQHEVRTWVAGRPRAEVLKILDEFEVVSAQVNDARDITRDPHFLERTLVSLTGSEALGTALMPGPVLHMASSPAPAYDGVPAIGEHTAAVLAGTLHLSPAELAELAGRGIVTGLPGQAPGQVGRGDGHRERAGDGDRPGRCRRPAVAAVAQLEDGELGAGRLRASDHRHSRLDDSIRNHLLIWQLVAGYVATASGVARSAGAESAASVR